MRLWPAVALMLLASAAQAADPTRVLTLDAGLGVVLPADFDGSLEPHPAATAFLRATDGSAALTIAVLADASTRRRSSIIDIFARHLGDAFGPDFKVMRHDVDIVIGKQRTRGVRLDIHGGQRTWTAFVTTLEVKRRLIALTHVAFGEARTPPDVMRGLVFR
jgi:hypothetical protein